MSTPSLAALHDRLLHLSLPKGSRLTDWLARPLTDDQLDYAASDVSHLLEIQDHIIEDLAGRGRLQWALDECSILLESGRGRRDPDEAWRRIKAVRQLKGQALGAARLIAAWREDRAAELDQPVRFILSDLAIVGIAQRKPKTVEQLRSVRGVDERLARGELGSLLLDLVAKGADLPSPTRSDQQRRDPRPDLRPAVALVAAWTAQLANRNDLDPALLATRADIEALVRGDAEARLAAGWRADIVGAPIRALMSGDAAIAFDSSGELVLENRSHEPVGQ